MSASVYSPTAEKKSDETENGSGTAADETENPALKAPAFVAFYDYANRTDGRLRRRGAVREQTKNQFIRAVMCAVR